MHANLSGRRFISSLRAPLIVWWLASMTFVVPVTRAFQPPAQAPLPNLDQRIPAAEAPRQSPEQTRAAEVLRSRLGTIQLEFDPVTGSPRAISAVNGFLSGPDGEGRAVSKAAAATIAPNDPHRGAKAFLADHRQLFGHGPEVLAAARIKREFTTAHSGLKTVVWEQEVDGVPVFEAVLMAHTTRKGELVNLSSQFVPAPGAAADRGVNARAAVMAAPTISAAQAVKLAAENLGEPTQNESATAAGAAEAAPEKKQKFRAAFLRGEGDAKLIWVPVDKNTLRLCWDVNITVRQRAEMYRVLIDAQTGAVVIRRCLTAYISDASYRVFTSDSPSPFSPGPLTPLTNQPPLVARTLVTWPAFSTNASPAGWINDGGNETLGNNVDAHTDIDNNNSPDLPRPAGSPFRVFDFPLDLTQPPSTYRNAAVVQLFYVCNWVHDKLYELGFTEAAGNFQANNFGRGGLGNDAVQADAQDGGGTDNANMSTPSDGSPPRMQMYVFTGPTPDRDGDFDVEIVIHEYTHGLSNRRVGGGVGISALQSAGMGEGWSDWYGLTLLSEPGDDVNGNYAAGGYATYRFLSPTFEQNYYFGIRRYPYSTDMMKNPLTFKDIDPAQASAHAGIPKSPVIGGGGAAEVHNQGEVWCVTLWEARANLIAKHGFAIGNQLILQLVTDGMNLSPANPNFLQARDAIIQADLVLTGGANRNELWAAFAKRGMGATATSPSSSTTSGVHESFDMPDDLSISPSAGFTARGPVGGPFDPNVTTFTLTNTGAAPLNWTLINTTAWLNVLPAGGLLVTGAFTTVTGRLNASASSLPTGIYSGTVGFMNLTSGVAQGRAFTLRAGQPDYFLEDFTSHPFDLSYSTMTFTPDLSGNFYRACHESASVFPVDPAGGIPIAALADDEYRQVTLTNGQQVSIYGISSNAIFIGANGNVAFNPGPNTNTFHNTGGLQEFFSRTRVAPFYGDLNPAAGGMVSYVQLTDRFVATWQDVPAYGTANSNSFQLELFFDGQIRITWLRSQFATPLLYVGLSRGLGVPLNFLESDLNSYGSCLPALRVTAIPVATEGETPASGAGQIQLLTPLTTNLTVNLASSDSTEITVPSSVIIPAGQTNQPFDVTIIDDVLLDGTQTAFVSVAAADFLGSTAIIMVHDNETAALQVSLPPTVSEGSGPTQGVVSVSAAVAANVTVSLNSSDTSELGVPSSVVIPAGQTSAVFMATIVDDALIDGSQHTVITAHVQNWTDGVETVSVLDNENMDLRMSLAESFLENAGMRTNAGRVVLSGPLPTNLLVTLLSSDVTVIIVQPSVIIPAGQSTAFFSLTVVDDLAVDGDQAITVTASAPGFVAGSSTMIVFDDETPPVPSKPSPPDFVTNISANADLGWDNGRPGITNDIYFGTNSVPGAAEYLGSVTTGGVWTWWPLPLLAPNTTYYWQIVARTIGVTNGPVWQFTTRGLDHFEIGPVPSPQRVNQPFVVTVTARDEFNQVVDNFNGGVNLTAGNGSPSLISYWPFDGNATATRGTHGTLVGDVIATNDRNDVPGGALLFNGALQQYVSVAGGGGLNGATSGTISMWVKWSGMQDTGFAGTAGAVLARQDNYSFSDNVISLDSTNPAGARVTWRQNVAEIMNVSSASIVSNDTWRHLAVTFTGAVSQLFIDGVLQAMGSGGPLHDDPSIPLTIGAWIDHGESYSTASIDDVAIWNGPLSASQIAQLAAQARTPLELGTGILPVSVALSNGVWSGEISVLGPATNLILRAVAESGHFGTSNPFHVIFSNQPPVVLTQPLNRSVLVGTPVHFAVSVYGTPPFFYQWRFNGIPLPGETNASLILSGPTTNQSGLYSVAVFNPFGAAFSSNAFLNVFVAPPFFDDFDPGIDLSLWDNIHQSYVEANNYGGRVSGANSLWFGDDGERYAVTRPLDIEAGDAVDFYLRIADGDDWPWEHADLPDEGIVLEYSINGGASWVEFGRYDTEAYREWTHVTVALPPAAWSLATQFRWRQPEFSGEDYDHWALDDVAIMTGPPLPPDLYFAWAPIGSPVLTNAPFSVTIQARDALNQIDTNFSGPVFFRDAAGGVASNSILPSPPHVVQGPALNATYGYSFTPNTNLTVRAVRHYFGTKVSIWTDAGVLLTAQPITSVPGTWVETPLTNPVVLAAGTRYRVASYTGGSNYYYGAGLATNFSNGTINQSYNGSGDTFPTGVDGIRWWLVDLRFTAPAAPALITPTNSGTFTNGVWSGTIRVPNPVTNLALLADDGEGHYGVSNPFHVVRANQPPIIIAPPASQTVNAGRSVTFSANVYGAPNLIHQWRRNGLNLSNGGRISGANSAVLTISNVMTSDASLYSFIVGNAFGGAGSANALLTVNPVDHFTWSPVPSSVSTLLPFGVSIQARDFLENIATDFTGTVALSATIAGGGNPLPLSPVHSGAFSAGVWNGNLSIPQVATNVVLRAVDALGNVGLSAPIDTAQIADFAIQPTNQNVLPGTNVTLVAHAVGVGQVRYQWRFEGMNILDATNASYSFTNANLDNHHGNFSVVATDDLGALNSSNALVYVLAKPGIVQHIVSQSVLQGGSLTFSLVATGAPPLSYRWIKVGSPGTELEFAL